MNYWPIIILTAGVQLMVWWPLCSTGTCTELSPASGEMSSPAPIPGQHRPPATHHSVHSGAPAWRHVHTAPAPGTRYLYWATAWVLSSYLMISWFFLYWVHREKPKVNRRNKENIVFTSKIYFGFYCSYLFVSIMTEVTDKLWTRNLKLKNKTFEQNSVDDWGCEQLEFLIKKLSRFVFFTSFNVFHCSFSKEI